MRTKVMIDRGENELWLAGVRQSWSTEPSVSYVVVILAIAMLLVASDPNWSRAQDSTRTKLTYLTLCAGCHGLTGKGDGPEGASLSRRPRAFEDCIVMNNLSDDVLFRAIKYGGAAVGISDEMPGWAAGISDRDVRALVQYIRGFCKKALAGQWSDPIPAVHVASGCGHPSAGLCVAHLRVSAVPAHWPSFED